MTDTTIDARIASRVHAFGIANILAMLSDLALSDPVGLAETVAGDLPAPQRWQEARARSGWPVRLDDLIQDLADPAAPDGTDGR